MDKEVKKLFDGVNIGVHIVNNRGETILYNKACEEIEGINHTHIIGTNMHTLVQNNVYSESIALEVLESGVETSKTQRVNDRYILSCGKPIYKNGKMDKVIVNVLDITKVESLEKGMHELKDINNRMKKELDILNYAKDHSVIYKDRAMERIIDLCLKVAQVDSNVLILGETGVGKGVIAKLIYKNSARKDKPFIKVDCSAIPESLIESELFGYAEGAFTGSKKNGKVGLIQLANEGTLFLDEIGELPLNAQVKLLSLIQDKAFRRVGGIEDTKVDTRIIAATNKNLLEEVKAGRFREDLYYRLKIVPIEIPPLRERKDDIIPLMDYFLNKFNESYGFNKTMDSEAIKVLRGYQWPGNVRELENEIERLVVITNNSMIQKKDLLIIDDEAAINLQRDKKFKENVLEFERRLLSEYLIEADNITDLSALTGLEKSTLRKKAKRIGVALNFDGGNYSRTEE